MESISLPQIVTLVVVLTALAIGFWAVALVVVYGGNNNAAATQQPETQPESPKKPFLE